jgi:hypothetical protein
MEGKLDKLDNVSNAKPYHVEKIWPHNWNMEHYKKAPPPPQGTTKHQKGCEPLEEPN